MSSSHDNLSFNNESDVSSSILKDSSWITCICIVNFDLEYGQKLEKMIPSIDFDDNLLSTICFSSFPDCNIYKRDTIFTFKVCRERNKYGKPTQYYYGYVFFRQEKDTRISRGYLQKSVVIITKSNFVKLFTNVISLIGESYFKYGEGLLEPIIFNISKWPRPLLNKTLELPILGHILKFKVPPVRNGTFIFSPKQINDDDYDYDYDEGDNKDINDKLSHYETYLTYHTVDIYYPFRNMLKYLTSFWELMLLCKPILVLSSNPTISSQSVLALVSLISPLEYQGDFRPFITIHDQDFKLFSDQKHIKEDCILIGGTNPYFLKSLEHFPNIITLGDDYRDIRMIKRIKYSFTDEDNNGEGNKNDENDDIHQKKNFYSSNEFKNKFISKHKSIFNQNDSDMMKKIKKIDSKKPLSSSHNENIIKSNDRIVREYYHYKTKDFLRPLEDFISSLIPDPLVFTPFCNINIMKSFTESSCISYLIEKKISSSKIAFYTDFIRTKNFKMWFRRKKNMKMDYIKRQYHLYLESININDYLIDKSEVNVIDMYLKAKKQIEDDQVNEETIDIIKKHMKDMIQLLPNDLRRTIKIGNNKKVN